jgi:hypothetical protein
MLEQLLRDLNSNDPKVRLNAIRQAQALSAEELFRLVQMEVAASKRPSSLWFLAIPSLCTVGLMGFLGMEQPAFLLCFLLALLVAGRLWWFKKPFTQARASLAEVFSEVEDPRFIRILLASLPASYNDSYRRHYLIQALMRQLPALRADQAGCLNSTERTILYGLLTPYGDRNLMLVVLKALEQVGQPDAIPAVGQFAMRLRMVAHQSRRYDPELEQAAEDCLLFLQQRYEQTRLSQTLLRASDAGTHAPETLLRPVASQQEAQPEQLLRPLHSSEIKE